MLPEGILHLVRPGHQAVHKPGVKKITVYDAVLDESLRNRMIQKPLQNFFKLFLLYALRLFIFVLMKGIQQ